jgi:hypothetical protein
MKLSVAPACRAARWLRLTMIYDMRLFTLGCGTLGARHRQLAR